MIVSEIFHGVKCDRCGEICNETEHAYFYDKDSAIDVAMDSEWIKEKDKHYCPNCYEYDEEKDDNVPKKEYPKHLKQLKNFLEKTTNTYSVEVIEKEDFFELKTGIHTGNSLEHFEENYIKEMLDDKFISMGYKKHDRYTRFDCIIKHKK